MKNLWSKLSKPAVLFSSTVALMATSLLTGFFVNVFEDDATRVALAVVFGIFIVLLASYIFAGYAYNAKNELQKIYSKKGNLFRLYIGDKLFRTSVNNALTCFYALINAMLNFITSFRHHRWFFLSLAAIYSLIFLMKVYLLSFLGNEKRKQNLVIGILLVFMTAASSGIVILLSVNEDGFTSKNLIIYWNCLYTFSSVISTVISVSKALKQRDRQVGRFLAVKLANAIFSVFTLTTIMVLTFSSDEKISVMLLWCKVIGCVSTFLILLVATSQFLLYRAYNLGKMSPDS